MENSPNHYTSFTLDNGLRFFVIEDPKTTAAVLNILYDVGSRDESPERTGFAHLFEHLMFEGSTNIPHYDKPLQLVGGENNAFTSPDITNYYITLPAVNLETAFWLESDRMLALAFNEQSLDVQRKVVIEEFNQRYRNQPYGDVWHLLRPMVYTQHPYQWPTIGKDISHVAEATLPEVEAFFYKHYRPNHAIAVVAGPVPAEEVRRLAENWFGSIPASETPYSRNLPEEPKQLSQRRQAVSSQVPAEALYIAFQGPNRTDDQYYVMDLACDLLGGAKTSRLYQALVKDEPIFSNLTCYQFGSLDTNLIVIEGKLLPGQSLETAEAKVWEVVAKFQVEGPTDSELQRLKNQSESALLYGESQLLNRAMSLASFVNMGKPEYFGRENEKLQAVTTAQVKALSSELFAVERSNVLYYQKQNG